MAYANNYGEEFIVNYSQYDILTTDNKKHDRVINPFNLNITKNNPYNEEDKNKSCFLEIETEYENILVIFKTSENPSIAEMYEPYYDYNTNSYDVSYQHDLINDDNQLVIAFGTSIMVLDIDTFEVLNHVICKDIKNYAINLFYENNIYVVEDILNNFTFFDKNLNLLSEENDTTRKYKDRQTM